MNFKRENEGHLQVSNINLRELAKVLWLHKWVVLIVMIITFTFGVISVVLKAPVYQTTALMQINTGGSGASQLAGLSTGAGGVEGALQGQTNQAQIEMTLMQSAYILGPVIHKLNLDVSISPNYFPFVGSFIASHYKGYGVAPARLGLSSFFWGGESWSLAYFITPAADYQKKFKLVVGESQTYQLFDSQNQLVLTGLVGQPASSADGSIQLLFNSLNVRPGEVLYVTKLSFTATLQSLTGGFQMAELAPVAKGVSASGDTGIVQLGFNSSNPAGAVQILNTILELTLADNLHQKELSSSKTITFIQKLRESAKERMAAAQEKLNEAEQRTGVIDMKSQIAGLSGELAGINSQLIVTQVQRMQYQDNYTDENPIMQNVNAQIRSLEEQKGILEKQISSLPMKDQQMINLQEDVQVQTKIYTSLLQDEDQSLLMRASILGDLRVLSLAQSADEPLPQNTSVILLAHLLVGLILGSLIVLGRHQLKNVVSDPYWAEREFGIRTVGIMPYSQAQANAKKAYDEKESRSIAILAVKQPEDPCVESIRSLRTSLFFAMKEKQANIVNITGIIPQTGKSFISVNLAVILAQTGKRVVLIDADMRRGYLNRYFKKSHAPGLSDILAGIQPLEKVVSQTSVENLDFIATGIYPDNPSELLLNDRFKETLQALSKHYDVVVIDSPPILAVNDASVIAKESPINYLVIPGGQLKPRDVEAAIRRFHNDGVVLTGSLFNFAKQNAEKMSGHNYHKNYYTTYKKDTEQQKQT